MPKSTVTKFDRRVHLRPGPDNRQESVDRIVWGLRDRGVLQNRIETDVRYAREYVAGARRRTEGVFTPEVSMFGLASEHAMGGVLRCLAGDRGGWERIALALNYARTGMAVDRVRREAAGLAYTDPCGLGDVPAFLWFLAISCCDDAWTTQWSHYLYNLVSTRGLEDDFGDAPMFSFLWLMLRAQCEGALPVSSELESDLDALQPLVAEVADAQRFARALVDFLDYRLSRAYKFEDAAATRARSDSDFLFGRQWMAILPAELMGLRAVAKRLLGINLNLEVDHPLVRTPLPSAPRFERLPSDQLLEDITSASADYFDELWQPDKVVPLVPRGCRRVSGPARP